MPETPRSTFRLSARTRKQIQEIRKATGGPYSEPTQTRIIEVAIEELHRRVCPPKPTPPTGKRGFTP
jgi:hypothetical protein